MKNFQSIILLIIVSIYNLISGCNSNTFVKSEKEFVVKDTSKVTMIVLKNTNSNIILKKNNNNWGVNIYNANIDYINYLLKILNRIQIHSKISSENNNSIKKVFDSTYVEIVVYKNRKIINNYIVAPHPVNEFCYALSKKTEEIYTLYIPGYQYSLYPVFNTSVSHWRDKTLMGISPDEIESVTLLNSFKNEYSFKITSKGKRNYELEHLFQDYTKIEEFRSEKIERYLSYFQNIEFTTQIEKNVPFIYDSLQNEKSEYIILIKTKSDSMQLTTYPIYTKDQVNILGDSIDIDPDNLYATTNSDSNVYLLKYTDIDPIIKKYEYFITP